MAHIIAASENGPRSKAAITQLDKKAYENLILLCANCHTLVDKSPVSFPDRLIQQWKRQHVERLKSLFGVIEYGDRVSLRVAIDPSMRENRAIFDLYGPHNDYRHDPESEMANVWRRKMQAIVLPNNRKILALLDANRQLLHQEELYVLEAFRQHIDDLEAKHIGDGSGVVSTRFPAGMGDILVKEDYEQVRFTGHN